MVEEMIKLRTKLDELNIHWYDVSDALPTKTDNLYMSEYYKIDETMLDDYIKYHIDRTHFTYRNSCYSVINGFGTYGGYLSSPDDNQGLLELMIDDVEPIGYLTADEVISIVQSHNTTSSDSIKEINIINNLLEDAFSNGGRNGF